MYKLIIPIILIILVLLVLAKNIVIVQQSRAYVVERLGAFQAVWGVGIHLKIPFIERVARKVSLKEQIADFPPQPVISKDNVTIQVDTVLFFISFRVQHRWVFRWNEGGPEPGKDKP